MGVCFELAVIGEFDVLGCFESDVSSVALGVSDAEDVGVVEGDVALASDVNVSGRLVAFGVAFDGDVLEVKVAIADDGDRARLTLGVFYVYLYWFFIREFVWIFYSYLFAGDNR